MKSGHDPKLFQPKPTPVAVDEIDDDKDPIYVKHDIADDPDFKKNKLW